ncbi:hypothetical protein ACE6H2_017771 [Prunus campanulata]
MPPTPHPPPHHHPHSHSHSPHRPIDPKIWRTCAGNFLQIPILHSRVYNFRQGHLEQYSSSTPLVLSKPLILCRISAVHFLSDPTTDEVFFKLFLLPIPNHERPNHHEPPNNDVFDDADETDKVVSFAKILTPSDANNGGGFSVPRFCADSIFPALNYQVEPPWSAITIMFDVGDSSRDDGDGDGRGINGGGGFDDGSRGGGGGEGDGGWGR